MHSIPEPQSPPSSLQDDVCLRLDQQLCFALYAASLAMTKVYRPLLERLALTYPQYLVLMVLWERDGLGVGELGERLGLDSGTLTPLLKRLESQGHVRRERDAGDERRVQVHLTDAGRALHEPARALPPEILARSGCALPELRDLTTRLQALRQQLQQEA